MRSAIPAQERPARNALTVELSCANHIRKAVARVARSSAHPVFPSIERSTRSLLQHPTPKSGNAKGLKTAKLRLHGCSGLFPVSEGHKLIQNCLQSLEPPFLVSCCCCICPVHVRAIRFADLGYFFPQFLDTL
jgi:hypothetical protein